MINDNMYNSNKLPLRIFNNDIKGVVFCELFSSFEDFFNTELAFFLQQRGVEKIVLKIFQPIDIAIEKEYLVSDFANNFVSDINKEIEQDYINNKMTISMLIEEGILYSTGKYSFCIYYSRQFDLAIIGIQNKSDEDFFQKSKIVNIEEYLSIAFLDQKIFHTFFKKLSSEWSFS